MPGGLGGGEDADAPAQDDHAASVRAEVELGVVHEAAHELDAAAAVGVAGGLAAAAGVADGDDDLVVLAPVEPTGQRGGAAA